MREPWAYLEEKPAPDAPASDNRSGLYCPACRACGFWHCSEPEWCGNMRRMKQSQEPSPYAPLGQGEGCD